MMQWKRNPCTLIVGTGTRQRFLLKLKLGLSYIQSFTFGSYPKNIKTVICKGLYLYVLLFSEQHLQWPYLETTEVSIKDEQLEDSNTQ